MSVPTEKWRNAMTMPRELKIKNVGTQIYVASEPVVELKSIESNPLIIKNILVDKFMNLTDNMKKDADSLPH